MWILLVLFYSLLKGSREIVKKLAMTKNTVMEVLVVYTLISFIFVVPLVPVAFGMEPKFYFLIALKSFAIFVAWICGFYSLKKLPVSVYGILDLSRVIFATLSGVFFLGEVLKLNQIAGLACVCAGLLLLRFKPGFLRKLFGVQEEQLVVHNSSDGRSTAFFVVLAFINCILNAFSGLLDKILMKDITANQLQFWFVFFLAVYYLIYIAVTRTKISGSTWKNGWVWLMAIMLIVGDKALFIANANPESRITVMTLVKQSACLITIVGGRLVFKEKNTPYKLFCAGVIILGIVLGIAFR